MENTKVHVEKQYNSPAHSRKKRRVPLGICLGYLFVITLLMTNITISGYITKSSSNDGARVAIMASKASIQVDAMLGYPGDYQKIPINITNQEGDRVCEVAQTYSVEAKNLTNNIPLEFSFYSDEECTMPINGNPSGTFEAGVGSSEAFWLKITWPAEQNKPELAFALDACEITVLAEQIN